MYSVFQKCYQHELSKLSTTEKDLLCLFTLYFTDKHYEQHRKKINSIGFLKHKFHIFINYYYSKTLDERSRNSVLSIFCSSQKNYLSLLNFKKFCMWKRSYKQSSISTTIEFDLLSEIQEDRKISIVDDNTIYTFSIYDIIKIINKSLTFHIDLFSDPIKVKNPWTNNELTYTTLVNIYHHILFHSSITNMPLLLRRFYMANFDLANFERNNEYLINDTIIKSVHHLDDTEIIKYINMMIVHYNKTNTCLKIKFDKMFPVKEKIEIMLPYLKYYVQFKYSNDEKTRQYNKLRYLHNLSNFVKSNHLTGREIVCTYILKLFKVSLLHYKGEQLVEDYKRDNMGLVPTYLSYEKIKVHLPSSNNTYPIPNISMIDLTNHVYWIGRRNISDYSIFIDINAIPKHNRKGMNIERAEASLTFRDYVKDYKFTTQQLFYFDKYLPKYISRNKQTFLKCRKQREHVPSVLMNNTQRVLGLTRFTIRPPTPVMTSDDDSDDEISNNDTEYLDENIEYNSLNSEEQQYDDDMGEAEGYEAPTPTNAVTSIEEEERDSDEEELDDQNEELRIPDEYYADLRNRAITNNAINSPARGSIDDSLLIEIFGYDSDDNNNYTGDVGSEYVSNNRDSNFNHDDFSGLEERIINSLPPSSFFPPDEIPRLEIVSTRRISNRDINSTNPPEVRRGERGIDMSRVIDHISRDTAHQNTTLWEDDSESTNLVTYNTDFNGDNSLVHDYDYAQDNENEYLEEEGEFQQIGIDDVFVDNEVYEED